MSKFAILTTVAVCVAALVVVPMVTPAKAAASRGKPIKKHERVIAWSPGFGDPWSTGQVARPYGRAGGACPGNARGIDCATWPPPFDGDNDRISGDGGS
jgi:hypothetical protein